MHDGHKLYEISDQESLKKENITIEASSNDFNRITEKIKNLREKIEKEILSIDELYEKVFNEVEKSFLKRHEQLRLEENNLKENLQNEVTKVKEKLELHLTEANKLVRENERIIKGINSMKNEDENLIKKLSYVSKINKKTKDIMIFFSELMRNLEISFQEEQNKIIYEEYYFNGFQIPENIKFENIKYDSFTILWQVKDMNIKNIEKIKFKNRIEIRQENGTEKFTRIYEGDKMTFTAKNLTENTCYEIRICFVYDDKKGPWSEIMKIKTSINIDSQILGETNKKKN
jgi:hypothetical protein